MKERERAENDRSEVCTRLLKCISTRIEAFILRISGLHLKTFEMHFYAEQSFHPFNFPISS